VRNVRVRHQQQLHDLHDAMRAGQSPSCAYQWPVTNALTVDGTLTS
jgi:hypothetical protein